MTPLTIEPLTKAAFAPFGDVIQTEGAAVRSINEDTTARFHDLADIDVSHQGGKAMISIFRATQRARPLIIRMLERHPLGSQAFFPLDRHGWLVVVCGGRLAPDLATLRCFGAAADQGVNLKRGVWHHPLLIRIPQQDFIVIDRDGPGETTEEAWFSSASDQRLIDI